MRSVRVFYRSEPDGTWVATSPDVPGYVGYGDSYEETRDRIQEGLPWFAEEDDLLLAHIIADKARPPYTTGPSVSFAITGGLPRRVPLVDRELQTERRTRASHPRVEPQSSPR